MSERLGILMFCGLVLLFSLPALIALWYFGKKSSRSLKIVLNAAILSGNLAGLLFIVSGIQSHSSRDVYCRNLNQYKDLLAVSNNAQALDLTRAWHFDPLGPLSENAKTIRDPNFGGIWEFRLPAEAKFSDYDRQDGVYITIGNAPSIAFYAGRCQAGQSLAAAIRAETEHFLGVFKTPIEVLARKENCEFGKWRGTYLRLYVPARKNYLENWVLGSDMEYFVLGQASKDEKHRFDMPDFVSNLRFLGFSNAEDVKRGCISGRQFLQVEGISPVAYCDFTAIATQFLRQENASATRAERCRCR